MRTNHRYLLSALLVLVSLLFSACAQPATIVEKVAPSKTEKIEGSDLKRVILTEKAAERLNIQTAPVREEQVIRTRTVGGMVVTPPEGTSPGAGKVWVRVTLNESDLAQVDQTQAALILSLEDEEEDTDEAEGLEGELDEGPDTDDDDAEAEAALYYLVDNADNRLIPGQRVFVELVLAGSDAMLKVVPYAAVIYDVSGKTWVYTNPEPLVFLRASITIDYIEDDSAYLTDGPVANTQVVTVGGAELYGAEVGVSK